MYVPDMKSKSSKVETLRGAIDYIKRLKELLGQDIDDTAMGSIQFEEDDMTGKLISQKQDLKTDELIINFSSSVP